ncbi:MAG: pyridoxamine 5'-phosphate oxidase family protein [Egibacteraceae bacterium]
MMTITEHSRPQMVDGYGLLNPSEGSGLLSWSVVEQQLVAARNYWIATTRPDGRSHCMPVWGVWADGAFYFGTDGASRKGRNLQANPHAVVHLESGDEAVILEGVVEHANGHDAIAQASARYATKYDLPESLGDSPLMLRPRAAFAWRERDFPGSATRWRFGE